MDQPVAKGSRLLPRPSAEALRSGALALTQAAALAAIVLALAPVSAQAASTFQFAGQVPYKTGEAPESVAVGDLNGDKNPDLVTANRKSNGVSVLIGKGDGTFAAQAEYPTGEAPTGVAIADVNGDGRLDIVTADEKENSVSVLINNGGGTFKPPAKVPTGEAPVAVAVADLGNGKPDIVTASRKAAGVSVLINEGEGKFAPPKEIPTGTVPGSAPVAVALADLNGDGKPDIVTANEQASSVSVLINGGAGNFGLPEEYPTAEAPSAVAVGDLNGDLRPDIVAADKKANGVSVLLGKGDGTFGAQKEFKTGKAPTGVALADLNADGKPDIVTANSAANTVSVLLGKGDGTFATGQDFATGAVPKAIAVAAAPDLNGDKKPDVVTANVPENTVSVLLNTSLPALETSAGSLSFPPQLFGTKSAAQKVTVTNTGSATLSIGPPTVTGNFAASGCAGSMLAPGSSCSLAVTFSPKGYGSLKGEATVASNAGSKTVKLSGTGLPPAPSVTTGPVGEIEGSYVTLTGTVISQGPGSFDFQYGRTKSYGSVTPTLPLSSSTTAQLLAATLSLSPGTTYHYRLVASNLAATVYGADRAFTIPPESPLLRLLKHGRLASVLRRGLRLRVSDTSRAIINVRLLVDPQTARAAHLISGKRRRKTKVTVGRLRVRVAANHRKTVTVKFSGPARGRLARLDRLRLTISATASTLTGVAGSPTNITARIQR
jgi:hypothetical protein